MGMYRILVINPGSTSTKVSVFEDEKEVYSKRIHHSPEELRKYNRVVDQHEMRKELILETIESAGYPVSSFDAVAARGGILPPIESGTYRVNEEMVDYLLHKTKVDHASNLGPVIAYEIFLEHHIPAFTTDPVSVDEFDDLARFSGIPEISRRSLSHALNMKAVGRKVAKTVFQRKYEECNFVIAHLGGGISVSAHRKGRMIDVNNANDEGPFSPERTGELPVGDVVRTAFSGKYKTSKELKDRYTKRGGLVAYLRTNDLREAIKMAKNDGWARTVLKAMVLQIAKEIGAMCTVLKGDVDAIIITGGMANNSEFVEMIKEYVSKYALVTVVPGENEMEALALGALRILRGEEEPKEFRVGC